MKNNIPKGILIPIGGGEDRLDSKNVLFRVIEETGKKNPQICLITLATGFPEKVLDIYKTAFKALKISKITSIHYTSRPEASLEKNMKKIRECDLILFCGGQQLKLSTLLGGTALLELIRQRYHDEPDFVVAGTSAGAAAMSNTMIISGSSTDALIKGSLELTNGLDLINNVSIDTHFIQRGRIGRLIETVTCNPGILGLGLGEDTGVIINKGMMEVIGSGLVTVLDGNDIIYSNLTEIKDGTPITVEGIKVHILGPGKKFIIEDRKLKIEEK